MYLHILFMEIRRGIWGQGFHCWPHWWDHGWLFGKVPLAIKEKDCVEELRFQRKCYQETKFWKECWEEIGTGPH